MNQHQPWIALVCWLLSLVVNHDFWHLMAAHFSCLLLVNHSCWFIPYWSLLLIISVGQPLVNHQQLTSVWDPENGDLRARCCADRERKGSGGDPYMVKDPKCNLCWTKMVYQFRGSISNNHQLTNIVCLMSWGEKPKILGHQLIGRFLSKFTPGYIIEHTFKSGTVPRRSTFTWHGSGYVWYVTENLLAWTNQPVVTAVNHLKPMKPV